MWWLFYIVRFLCSGSLQWAANVKLDYAIWIEGQMSKAKRRKAKKKEKKVKNKCMVYARLFMYLIDNTYAL